MINLQNFINIEETLKKEYKMSLFALYVNKMKSKNILENRRKKTGRSICGIICHCKNMSCIVLKTVIDYEL